MFNKLKKSKTENGAPDQVQVLENDIKKVTVASVSKIVDSTQKPSIISEGASFKGDMFFSGQLHLDGFFEGKIKADKITIGKNGNFIGDLDAKVVVVFGGVKGEVLCQDLTLNVGSSIDGIVNYESIKIESGSSITGQLNSLSARGVDNSNS